MLFTHPHITLPGNPQPIELLPLVTELPVHRRRLALLI